MAHIIVVGNEKGGAGKSTVTMHIATALARMGHRVGAIDLDLRQQSFVRYLLNRQKHLSETGIDLPSPRISHYLTSRNHKFQTVKISMITDYLPLWPKPTQIAILFLSIVPAHTPALVKLRIRWQIH